MSTAQNPSNERTIQELISACEFSQDNFRSDRPRTKLDERIVEMKATIEIVRMGQSSGHFADALNGIFNQLHKAYSGGDDNERMKFFVDIPTNEADDKIKRSLIPTSVPTPNTTNERKILSAFVISCFAENIDININTLLSGSIFGQPYVSVLLSRYISDDYVSHISVDRLQSLIHSSEVGISKLNSISESADSSLESKLAELENAIKRANAFAKYANLDNHFKTKATHHNRAFKYWLVAFFSMMGLMIGVVWINWTDISTALPVYSDKGWDFGKSALIAVAILFAIWVLRACMKFATLSFRLEEDATNRMVLIRTLAAIEDDKTARLEKEERVVAYNAIFRPSLPDGSDTDIAPTTLADLASLVRR